MSSRFFKILYISLTLTILIIAVVLLIVTKKQSVTQTGKNATSETQNGNISPLPQAGDKQMPQNQQPPVQAPFPIEKQDTYSYDALKADSEIINSVQKIKSDFNLNDIGVSLPSATSKIKNGDKILIYSGCTPHNCGGTNIVIAYDQSTKQAYLLQEKVGTVLGYQIYGNPPDEIKSLLVYDFLHP